MDKLNILLAYKRLKTVRVKNIQKNYANERAIYAILGKIRGYSDVEAKVLINLGWIQSVNACLKFNATPKQLDLFANNRDLIENQLNDWVNAYNTLCDFYSKSNFRIINQGSLSDTILECSEGLFKLHEFYKFSEIGGITGAYYEVVEGYIDTSREKIDEHWSISKGISVLFPFR